MKLKNIFFSTFTMILLISSCATSMTPSEVNNSLPTLTKSTYYNQVKATEAINTNNCKLLVKGRSYVAPMGFSLNDDLRNGAKGIDEWVQVDGGNAYVLVNYKWVNVGDEGGTQLHIDFDTMLCQ